MTRLKVPIITVIIGEGASGGALGIGVGDKELMLENTWYSVISPESCSSILWRSWEYKEQAASALKLTAKDMKKMKLVDHVIKEPLGGAHSDREKTFLNVRDAILRAYSEFQDLSSKDLLDRLSEYTNTDKEFIQVYNGSDSALDHSFRILLNDGDNVIIPAPNYSQINQTITSLGGIIKYCDIGRLEETIKETKNLKVVYISNPNNPIGYVYDIKPLVKKYPEIFFIVDEAYYEFSKQYSMFDSAFRYPNVIVTRTFSKALGLASIRLGYLTSNSYIVSKLSKIKNFKEVNQIAQIAGKVVLDLSLIHI